MENFFGPKQKNNIKLSLRRTLPLKNTKAQLENDLLNVM